MSNASQVMKSIVAVLAAAVAGSLCAAEWLGTGSDTCWNNADNWESATGVPVGNIAFSAKAGDNKTVTLDGNNSFNGTFAVSAGTAEAPFVFTAIDATEEMVPTLNQTSANGMDVTGALKIEKGNWNFANDLKPNGAFLWITGGRLTTQYWMPVDGETTIRVDGGELVTGCRDNGEQNNGRMNLGRTSGKTVTLIQNGGRIRCSNNTNKGNLAEALTLGEAQNSTVLVTMTGGELVVNGCAHFGYGASSKGSVTVTGGTFSMPDADPVLGYGAGSVAELTIGGTGIVSVGTPTTAKWLKICENASATSTVTLNEGGVLELWHVQKSADEGAAAIVFNGGTLRALGSDNGYNKYLLGNYGDSVAANLSVTVSENGGVIDNNGNHIRINQPISGEGTLTFTGAGHTEVLRPLDCSVRVAQGIVAVPSGCAFGGLEIEPGAFLILASGTSPEPGATLLTVSSDISALAGRIVINGLKTVISESDGKWIVRGEVATATPTYVIPEEASFAIEKDYTWALAANWVVDGTLTIRSGTVFAGNLSGSGLVEVVTSGGDVTLSGDNEAFAGTVNKPWKESLRFDSETSGSPLATWNLAGDLRTSIVEGTLKFGAINYAMKDTWYVFYAEQATELVIEIGAKEDVNSNLGTADHICQMGGNTSKVTIRKVGAGNLDMWFDKYEKIDLHEGTVSFQNNNGPFTAYTFTGGTMKIPYVPNWNFLDRIKGSTSPVAIDTDGVDISFYQKGTVDGTNVGGFTKKGEGQLTIWADLAYTGPTTVEGGALLAKGGLDNAGGAIAVAEDAQLKLYVDHIAFTDGTPVTVLKGSVDEDTLSRVLVSGVNREMTLSAGEEGVDILATSASADNSVPNRWVGLNSDNWTTAACWSKGCPQKDQSIQIDYTARIANIQGSIDLNKIIIAAGAEAQFVTRNYSTHPSINVNGLEVLGEGEATIALDHCGVQSRVGRYDTLANLNFRMVSTTTDSWLRNLNLKGKLLGNGILRPYSVNFYGDNSDFEGKVYVADAGSRICTEAASLPKAVLELAHDISFDLMEGTFKIGSLDTREQRLFYTKNGSTAVIEVGHRNEDFGRADSKYFFGPESYNLIDVPELTFKKVGTGKWTNSMKGMRHVVVEEGELALVDCPCGDHKFDNNHGYEIDSLTVCSNAVLSGTSGNQPIYALTLEKGAIVREELAWDTVTEGETVTTNGLKCVATLNVTGDVDVSKATFAAANPEILPAATEELAALSADWTAKLVFLTATGTMTGMPTAETTAWPVDGKDVAGYQPVGSTKGWGWLVKKFGASVKLVCGRARPGLVILFL